MSAMTTALRDHLDMGVSRVYAMAAHAVNSVRTVTQRRKEARTATAVAEDVIRVVYGTVDSAGVPLVPKISFEVCARRPANAVAADIAACKATFLDIVNSDEFANVVTGQAWLK